MRSHGSGKRWERGKHGQKILYEKNIFSVKRDHKMTSSWVDLVSPNPRSPTALREGKKNMEKGTWTPRQRVKLFNTIQAKLNSWRKKRLTSVKPSEKLAPTKMIYVEVWLQTHKKIHFFCSKPLSLCYLL